MEALVTHHQSPRMQSRLIIATLKVDSSEPEDSSVIPPDKTANDDIKDVCDHCKGPKGTATYLVLGSEFHEE